jgi:hypothetical protein
MSLLKQNFKILFNIRNHLTESIISIYKSEKSTGETSSYKKIVFINWVILEWYKKYT